MSDTTTTTNDTPTQSPSTPNRILRSLAALIGGVLTMWLTKQFKIELPMGFGEGIVDVITMVLAAGVGWIIARIFPKSKS